MKQIIFYIFLSSSMLHGSHAYFQAKVLKKNMYLSVASKTLLKTMIVWLQELEDARLIDTVAMDRALFVSGQITSLQINAMLGQVRAIKQKTLKIDVIWGCKRPSQQWQDIFIKIKQGLDGARLLNHQADLQWIKSDIQQLQTLLEFERIETDKVSKLVVRLINVCNELMHHLDGYFVTEYDFLILYHVIMILQLLQCRL